MKSRFVVISGVLFAVAAIAVLLTIRVRAQEDSNKVHLQRLEAIGYRSNSSSPFVLQSELLGDNATWHPVLGPIVSSVIATIPSTQDPTAFGGAVCRADHSQDEIVTQEGSTLTVSVYGFRCEPNDPSITGSATSSLNHGKIGFYSVVSGTGRFQSVCGGTGSVAFDFASDGSASIKINGLIVRMPKSSARAGDFSQHSSHSLLLLRESHSSFFRKSGGWSDRLVEPKIASLLAMIR